MVYVVLLLPLAILAGFGSIILSYRSYCKRRSYKRDDVVLNILSDRQYRACVCENPYDTLVNVGFADGHKRRRVVGHFLIAIMLSILSWIGALHWVAYVDMKQKQEQLNIQVERIANMENVSNQYSD